MKNVLVVFGGVSPEHDVSVLTGVFTANCLDKEKFNAVPVYVNRSGVWFTGEALKDVGFFKAENEKRLERVTLVGGSDKLYSVKNGKLKSLCAISCAINCMHGKNGEDGMLAGIMQASNIPLASPDLFSASVSLDKHKTKIVLNGLEIDNAPFTAIDKTEFYESMDKVLKKVEDDIGFPAIVKPCSSGSSIGISVVHKKSELIAALNRGFSYDKKCLVESFLGGATEINCAAYRSKNKITVSECERPYSKGEFLSFSDKYSSAKIGAGKEFPAKISEELSEKIKSITEKVYDELGFSGVIRVDYLVSDGKVFLNEINSVPGSLAYYLFCDKIAKFPSMLCALIEQAIADNTSNNNCVSVFDSDVLSFSGICLKK